MNHHNSPKVTVVFDIPPMSAGELAKRRELFERVSLPTLILRLAAAVEGPQALRKSVENRMSKGGKVMGLRGDAQGAHEEQKQHQQEEEAEGRLRKVAWLRERLKSILPAEYHERMVDKPNWTALDWYEQQREAGVDAPMPADIQPRPVIQVDDTLFTVVYASGNDIRLMEVCQECGDPVIDYSGLCHDDGLADIGKRYDDYSWLHTCRTVAADANNDTCPFLSIGSDSWQECLKEKCRIFEKVEQECPFRLIGQFISLEFARAAARER